ncbi:macrolide ABC transporter ATP-binding protein [[Clostridium] innocuum]|uniref:Macrolide ABC transporter ATP-binding protein n=1 Tax=Clostridium innocuum TaxID=1522 RepID=A0A099I3I6_CLOIN|nr:ABC transporter permease [[Clostridium] innocuum]KGJ52529.1 macrolide ABC transporter ATP-binding protein [[Clostridium] innocuum]
MRNPLHKTLKKEFLRNRSRYISLSLVLILMIGVVTGFLSVAYSAKELLIKDRISSKVEDGQLALRDRMDVKTKTKLEALGLKVYEQFYTEQSVSRDTMVRVYRKRFDINRATLHEGRMPNKQTEIALDRLFALKNGYNIRDTIRMSGKSMTITGLISVPDYTSLIQKNSDMMMDPIHFGIAIVTDTGFQTLSTDRMVYSYSYYLDDRELNDFQKQKRADDIQEICIREGAVLENLLTAQMNQAISFLPNDMGSDIPMVQTLLYIILMILAFIFVVISQTMIEEQASVIGTLLASGYTRRELLQHYMMLPTILIIVSAGIGNLIGYTLFPNLFTDMYYSNYCLPPLSIQPVSEALLSTTVMPFIFMMLILYVLLERRLRLSPLRFLRKDLRRHRQRRYIPLHGSSFFQRFRIRIILQNKGSYLVLFLGIIFASFLLMFALILTPSMEQYIRNLEADTRCDYQYLLKAPVQADGEKVTLTSLKAYYVGGDLDLDVTLYGLGPNSGYYTDMTLSSDPKSIVISSDFASKMSLQVGDAITLRNPYRDKAYSFTIQDIYPYNAGFSAYMPRNQLNQLLHEDHTYFNGYLSNQPLDIEEAYVQSVVTRSDLVKINEQMTQAFSQPLPVLTSVSIAIYLVVLYILTRLVIDRNAISMSFLKVMGYTAKEIRSLYLHATTLVVLASLTAALPLCNIALRYLMKFAFMKFTGNLSVYIPGYVYFLVFVTGGVAYLFIKALLTRRIEQMELGYALKEDV